MAIEFKKGTFLKLEATTTIHLGRFERNLVSGDIVEFDGSDLRMGGEEISMPELKAGIKRGWLKIHDVEAPAPVKAQPVKAEPAKKTSMKVETVYDEETKVSEIESVQESVQESVPVKEENKFPVVVSTEDEDNYLVGTVESVSGADISSASSAEDALAEMQGAQKVNLNLKTATQAKTVITDANAVGQEIEALESAFEAEIVEEVESETPVEEEAPVEEAQILDALDSDPEAGAVEVGETNDKLKSLPSGVEWDLTPHWTKRVKKALELYSDNPEILEEIKAVESAGVVSGIEKGLEDE